MNEEEVKVVKTDEGNINGQEKCPKCGATDISLNVNTGKLRCNFCRHEFEPSKVSGFEEDIANLKGQVIASGASDIVSDSKDMITLKCTSCGAEVVIDTSESTQARCHWCRNTLSINEQIPNGSVPDVVLPFSVKKDDARAKIEEFVGKRKFYAHPKFKEEFTTENIMGVYFPYMIVDVNAHANLKGQGEHLVRQYTVGSDDHKRTLYDADLYDVEREFDIAINGLTVESSKDKLNNTATDKTNNIINAIMPFDIDNCNKWDSNYLKGYTSERRDTNVSTLKPIVTEQSKDIARHSVNNTLGEYNRGVRWDKEDLTIKGEQWKSAYLPVWLYSYRQVKGDKSLLHYVAVNARTKKTMGSVPIHMPKLIGMSILVELISLIMMAFIDLDDGNWIFFLPGIIYFLIIYNKYRNKGARHTYEKDTKKEVSNLRKLDKFVKHEKGLSNSRMTGANNTLVRGSTTSKNVVSNNMLEQIAGSNPAFDVIKNSIDKNKNK